MKHPLSHRLVFAFPVILLALLLQHSWFGPDIWYHLTWGRSLLENFSFWPRTQTLIEQPIYANGYWLFQIAVTLVMRAGGFHAVSLLFLLLWLAIATLWLRQTGAWTSGVWGVSAFLAFILLAQLRFEPRPEVFSYLFLALEIICLTHWSGRRRVMALFAVQALWVNSHGYFALGPLLGCAFAVAELIEGRRTWTVLAPLGALGAGCLVSPFPLGVWQAVAAYVDVGHALKGINQELAPPVLFPLFWPLTLFWIAWGGVLLTATWSLMRRRNVLAGILAWAGVVLAYQATRNIPLFLILASPVCGVMLARLAERRTWWPLAWVPATAAAVISVFVVRGDFHKSVMSLGSFGVKLEPSAFPLRVGDYLEGIHFSGKLFCDSYDAGYLEYRFPGVRVIGDSYFSDPDLTLKYFTAIRDPRVMRAMDEVFHFDGLVINVENTAVIESLWNDPVWHLAFVDSHRALYLRDGPAVPYSSGNFYEGEDLRHWANAFGVSAWAPLAAGHHDIAMMTKMLRDLKTSPAIPAEVIEAARRLAEETHDPELAKLIGEFH